MSILRVLAVAATLWLPVHIAWADDNPPPRTDCPSLNGTWKVRYVFDNMGAPIDVPPLRPWPKLAFGKVLRSEDADSLTSAFGRGLGLL